MLLTAIDSRFAGRGIVTTLAVRRAESGGDRIAGISRRAVDGVLQPFAGRGAETQTRGVIGGDGESADPNRERGGAPQEEAVDGDRDCFEGGQGAGALQDGQTLRASDRG